MILEIAALMTACSLPARSREMSESQSPARKSAQPGARGGEVCISWTEQGLLRRSARVSVLVLGSVRVNPRRLKIFSPGIPEGKMEQWRT